MESLHIGPVGPNHIRRHLILRSWALGFNEYSGRAITFRAIVDDQVIPLLGGDQVIMTIESRSEKLAQMTLSILFTFVGIDLLYQAPEMCLEGLHILSLDGLLPIGGVEDFLKFLYLQLHWQWSLKR